MVYVSVKGRIWLQAEAMNMVESVGNYVKHRKVPVMVREGGGHFMLFFVPAISGESVAHAYQVLLAEEMRKAGQSVCSFCSKGIFLKSMNKGVYTEAMGEKPPAIQRASSGSEEVVRAALKIEETIVRKCAVEDVGGFLYAEEPNVKRTSNFSTGYMIPVREALKVTVVDPQLQSRYALGTKFVAPERREEGETTAAGQTIYYVEVSSALFTFSFDMDTANIGKYTFVTSRYNEVVEGVDPAARSKVALEALQRFLVEFPVGAKRSRFNPAEVRWDSIALAVSDSVFTLPSSFTSDYITRAARKKGLAGRNTEIFAFSEDYTWELRCFSTPEEAIVAAVGEAVRRLTGSSAR
uniref:Type I-A CRISPR-associated protein Cas7/Csa2 n=1 Tax=Thermofilum pendens TaxID=2269 RepID=A0A7C4FE42_THEPE